MFRSPSRGFAILPALVLVAVLGVAAMGIGNLASGANPAAQTATVNPAVSNAKAVDAFKSDAPKDCYQAIGRAFEKTSDPPSTNTDNGQPGTLDTCYGAVLKDGKKPSTARSDYECVGRFGTATIENGKITTVTNALRGSGPKECRIQICKKDSDGKPVCEAAKLYKGGVKSSPLGGTPALSPGDVGTSPTPLDARGQKELGDAFALQKESAATQATDNEEAIKRIDEIKEGCGLIVCNPDDTKDLDARRKALVEENAKLKAERDRLNAAQVALKPTDSPNDPPDPNKPYYLEQVDEKGNKVWCDQSGNCKKATEFTPPPRQGGPPDQRKPGNTTGFEGDGGNPPRGSPGGGAGLLSSLLSGLMKGLMTPTPPQAPAQTCSTDPNAYAQQQQQYQQQQQQYNYQLQQYNYQQQLNDYRGYSGGYSMPPLAQPQPCRPSTGGQCTAQPPQPNPSSCSNGSWRPTYNGVCVTSWRCSSGDAQLSCQPQVADVGMTLAIAYSCASGTASSTGFTITTQPSGTATTTVASPPAGTNTATYTLTCNDQGGTTGAQCSVQVGRPSIILIANPRTVAANGISLLGWITRGMQSCVISSPDQADFTARNSSNTSPNGVATTSPIPSQASFLLHCVTIGGGTKDATTTIMVAP